MKLKTSQIAAEFLFITGFLMLVFIGFIILSYETNISYRKISQYLDVREECLKLSDMVSAVHVGGPRTEIKTKTKYAITFFNASSINVGKSYYSIINAEKQQEICTFYGNLKKDYQFTGDIIIKNVDNEVIITNETS